MGEYSSLLQLEITLRSVGIQKSIFRVKLYSSRISLIRSLVLPAELEFVSFELQLFRRRFWVCYRRVHISLRGGREKSWEASSSFHDPFIDETGASHVSACGSAWTEQLRHRTRSRTHDSIMRLHVPMRPASEYGLKDSSGR